jgi:hypothetical protein
MGLFQKIKSLFSKKKNDPIAFILTTPEPVVVDNESVKLQTHVPKPTPKVEKKKPGPKPKKKEQAKMIQKKKNKTTKNN